MTPPVYVCGLCSKFLMDVWGGTPWYITASIVPWPRLDFPTLTCKRDGGWILAKGKNWLDLIMRELRKRLMYITGHKVGTVSPEPQ